jgi:hypothetical protein
MPPAWHLERAAAGLIGGFGLYILVARALAEAASRIRRMGCTIELNRPPRRPVQVTPGVYQRQLNAVPPQNSS